MKRKRNKQKKKKFFLFFILLFLHTFTATGASRRKAVNYPKISINSKKGMTTSGKGDQISAESFWLVVNYWWGMHKTNWHCDDSRNYFLESLVHDSYHSADSLLAPLRDSHIVCMKIACRYKYTFKNVRWNSVVSLWRKHINVWNLSFLQANK